MPIINAVMVPHPPLIVPRIGRGQERGIQATVDAYRAAAHKIVRSAPDTVVILSPHSAMYQDWFHISPGSTARGNFAQFGASDVRFEVQYDPQFASALTEAAEEADLRAGTAGERNAALDHGTMVPLFFLREAAGGELPFTVTRIGLSGLPLEDHYRLGMLIADTAQKLGRKVSIVASGDLSHRLKKDGPYGFQAEGPQYDERIMDVMGSASFGDLFDFSEAFCESAGECGHRSFVIMAGCLNKRSVRAERLSYEGPFGVGYGVCLFQPEGGDPERNFLERRQNGQHAASERRKKSTDPYVRLARAAVETYARTGRIIGVPEGLPEEMLKRRAGVFVSLKKNGNLRGCIGTISPMTACIAEEIIENAVSACSRDPRFDPVTAGEAGGLTVSVDVLGDAETIPSADRLDPKRYGVIVQSGSRRGLLLPDLEGVDTAEQQIAIAKRKADIGDRESVIIQRFEVTRHI